MSRDEQIKKLAKPAIIPGIAVNHALQHRHNMGEGQPCAACYIHTLLEAIHEQAEEIARLKEKLGIAKAKGAALVEQIDKGDFYDPESHSATMLQALHEFRAALAAIRETNSTGGE